MVTFISLSIVFRPTILILEGFQKVYLFLQVLHRDQCLEVDHLVVAYHLVAFHLEGDRLVASFRLVVLRLEGFHLVVDLVDDRLVAYRFNLDCLQDSFLVVGHRYPYRLVAFLANRLDFRLEGR